MGEKGLSRRVFLTTAASGVGAAALLATGGVALAAGTPAPAAPAPAPPAAPAAGKIWPSQPGRIVAVHHAGAMEKMEKPRLDVVGQMVDRGLLEFTGKSDLAAAWSQFVEPADVVEIKINCLGQRHNSSNAETVQAILRGLQAAGVKRISLGPALYTNAMTALEQAARALRAGDIASATAGIGFDRVGELLTRAS